MGNVLIIIAKMVVRNRLERNNSLFSSHLAASAASAVTTEAPSAPSAHTKSSMPFRFRLPAMLPHPENTLVVNAMRA